jgi:hypothetical protein
MIWYIGFTSLSIGYLIGAISSVIYYNLKKPIIKQKRLEATEYYFSKVTGTKIEQNIN